MPSCYSFENPCLAVPDQCALLDQQQTAAYVSSFAGCPATVDWFWWLTAAAAAVVLVARVK